MESEIQHTVGLQTQNDNINVGLNHTEDRELLSIVRSDRVMETSEALYYQADIQWLPKFRSETGVRADFYQFHVNSDNPANSGTDRRRYRQPEGEPDFRPLGQDRILCERGWGLPQQRRPGHDGDGDAGQRARLQPARQKVTPLVRSEGYEVGARTSVIPGLQSSLTLYRLDLGSELIFDGDAGTTTAGPPSRRIGVEFANTYSPTRWLTIGVDYAYVEARLTAPDPNGGPGYHIPGAVEGVGSLDAVVHDLGPFFGSLQLHYKGPYPLVDNNTERAPATWLLNGRLGYKVTKNCTLTLDGLNLLNSKASEHRVLLRLPIAGRAAGRGERRSFPSRRADHFPARGYLLFLKKENAMADFFTTLKALQFGGLMVYPLLFLGLIAVTIILDKAFVYWHYGRLSVSFSRLLEDECSDWADLEEEMGSLRPGSYFARFFGVILANRAQPPWWVESRAAKEARLIEKALKRGLWVLETIVTAAPLLGLVGTIVGMMDSFKLIGGSGLVNPTGITGGVAQALIATTLGLIIALDRPVRLQLPLSPPGEGPWMRWSASARISSTISGASRKGWQWRRGMAGRAGGAR